MKSPIIDINGSSLNSEQTHYLDGFFSGLHQQGLRFSDVAIDPVKDDLSSEGVPEDYSKEEKLKYRVDLNKTFSVVEKVSLTKQRPDDEETFLLKWHGLFHLAPKEDGFMCRLRIPGGYIKAFQMRELAALSREMSSGYLQITTRANIQLRVIPLEHAAEVLQRIQSVGLHTKGAGADNIRNITASPTAGFDPEELCNVQPLCLSLAQTIISSDVFYNLPRKFNIALDGGGAVGVVEDTNDIGARAVRVKEPLSGHPKGIGFMVSLGGVTGHKTFAADARILVQLDHIKEVILTMTQVFLEQGNRTNRKKARLKYLLASCGVDAFLDAVDSRLSYPLIRLGDEEMIRLEKWNPPRAKNSSHSHLGVHEQTQASFYYVGVGVPTGVLTPDQLEGLAKLSERYGGGEARLTVWQNLIIPHVAEKNLAAFKQGVKDLGLYVEPSHVRSGVVACTGNAFCKFASADTKQHARLLAERLESRCPLDQPINIHLTGCPHSCAQHYIGDIGLLATQVKSEDESVEGYHIFVGGGFGEHKEIGRQIAKSVPFEDLAAHLEGLLVAYMDHRYPDESFQTFSQRHSKETLQGWMLLKSATAISG